MEKRVHYMDVLNVLSCYAVVVLHCTLHVFGSIRDSYWKTALVLQGIFIFAVPVFFMLSGSHLLNYRLKYSTATFLKKRLVKVGVGLLVASAICYILYSAFPDSFYGAAGVARNASVRSFLLRFTTNTINDTYWFLYAIIYLYIITPLISLAAERKRLLEGYLLIGFCIAFILPMLLHLQIVKDEVAKALFDWPLLASTGTFYFVAGYYFSRWPIKSKQVRFFVCLIGIVSLVVMGLMGYKHNVNTKTYDSFFISEYSAFGAVYSVSVFVFFQSLEGRLSRLSNRILNFLCGAASATFFIYLFHVLFINWLGLNLHSELLLSLFYTYPLVKALFVFVVVGGFSLMWNALRSSSNRLICFLRSL